MLMVLIFFVCFHFVGRMFCLTLIEHNLRLPPHLLNRALVDAIKDELERLFLDKVQFIYS